MTPTTGKYQWNDRRGSDADKDVQDEPLNKNSASDGRSMVSIYTEVDELITTGERAMNATIGEVLLLRTGRPHDDAVDRPRVCVGSIAQLTPLSCLTRPHDNPQHNTASHPRYTRVHRGGEAVVGSTTHGTREDAHHNTEAQPLRTWVTVKVVTPGVRTAVLPPAWCCSSSPSLLSRECTGNTVTVVTTCPSLSCALTHSHSFAFHCLGCRPVSGRFPRWPSSCLACTSPA